MTLPLVVLLGLSLGDVMPPPVKPPPAKSPLRESPHADTGEKDAAKVFDVPALVDALKSVKGWALVVVNMDGASLPRQTKEPGAGFTYHLQLTAVHALAGKVPPEHLELYSTLDAMPQQGRSAAVLVEDGGWHVRTLKLLDPSCTTEQLEKVAKQVEAKLKK